MRGDKYVEFHFPRSSDLCSQNLHINLVFAPNCYNFEIAKVNYIHIGCYNIFSFAIGTIHFYVAYFIHLIFSSTICLILVNISFLSIALAQWI
jgi:hypothetical protein